MGLFGLYVTIKALWGMTFSNDPEDIKTQHELESWGRRVDLTLKGVPYTVVHEEEPERPKEDNGWIWAVYAAVITFVILGFITGRF